MPFSKRYSSQILLFLALVICWFLYWPGLYGPLILDDESNIGFLLAKSWDWQHIPVHLFSHSGPLGRPVAMASFMANAWFSQDLFFWKLSNLVIHLVSGLVVYGVTRQLVFWAKPPSAVQRWLPVLTAIIWLLHPLHISTVLYTVQRMTQLSTLFTLLAIYCYLRAPLSEWLVSVITKHSSPRKKPNLTSSIPTLRVIFGWQAATWLLFFPLAIYSKETAFLLPLLLLTLELFVIQNARLSHRMLLIISFSLAVIGVLIFALKDGHFLTSYVFREFTPIERLLTEGRILCRYLLMLLLPAQKHMGFLHDDVVVSTGLLSPWTTLGAWLFLLALMTSAFIWRKQQPLYSAGILFYFVGHFLESTFFALELMYEHRNYLPSVGLFWAVLSVAGQLPMSQRSLAGLASVYILLLSFTTWLRADTWGSDIRLYYHIERLHPKSERLAAALSSQMIGAGAFDQARKKLQPFNTPGAALQRLRIDCLEHGRLSDTQWATVDYQNFKVADSFTIMGLVDLANLGLDKKCDFSFEKYIQLLEQTLTKTGQMRSNRQMLFLYKAHYQWELKQHDKALATLQQSFEIARNNPTPLFLACEWALDEQRPADIKTFCPKAFAVADKQGGRYDELAEQVRLRLESK